MRELVARYRAFPKTGQGVFHALVRAILSQQISNRAARTIRLRLLREVGESAQKLYAAPYEQLRGCGISPRKITALQRVAQLELENAFVLLQSESDEGVLKSLTALPGVGAWTAEMVLLFGLHRPDVWPLSDHGLRAAAALIYDARSIPEIVELGERFRPWRSYAAWYLWRTLGN